MNMDVRRHRGPLAEVIEVSGELDLPATEALEPVFRACVEESDRAVVADYSGVRFVDSMAVAQLIRMRRDLAQDLRRFAVVSRLPKVRRVFTITGADRAVPVYDTLRDALAALPDPSARA